MNSVVGDPDANSYVDLTYANEFFANSVNSADWPTTDSPKETALIEATRLLDTQFDWVGFIATETQSLRWPRDEVYDMDGRLYADTVVPKLVKDATCNLAYFLIQSGGLTQSQSDLKSLKIGPIDLKFNEDLTVVGIPKFIAKSLQSLGQFQGVIQGSAYNVNALRS